MESDRTLAQNGILGAFYVEIDHNRSCPLLTTTASHDIRKGVDLLVWDEWRDTNEVARSGFLAELQVVTPPHACPAANNGENGFEFAMVMGNCFRVRLDHQRCPVYCW
jgi:hypothetical protein